MKKLFKNLVLVSNFQKIDQLTLINYENIEIEDLVPFWVTSYNEKIPVKSMTTNHILNCIKCWNGEGHKIIPKDYLGGKEKWLKIFNNELSNRN